MKRIFECGHKGKGKFCHRCAQEKEQRENEQQRAARREAAKKQWAASFEQDPVDLRGFPKGIVRKARHVLTRIQAGASIAELGGKRMHYDRHILSIPVGNGYRLICQDRNGRVVPQLLLTHEDYNNFHP
ncbi:MAG: hypothetical protein HPY51_20610 [Candidatus Omnitrophica bacterium]|nr:hypothetical protein [Candidatus Omnitrophota bacterium]HPP00593.1 hypothetical protein [bacterium]